MPARPDAQTQQNCQVAKFQACLGATEVALHGSGRDELQELALRSMNGDVLPHAAFRLALIQITYLAVKSLGADHYTHKVDQEVTLDELCAPVGKLSSDRHDGAWDVVILAHLTPDLPDFVKAMNYPARSTVADLMIKCLVDAAVMALRAGLQYHGGTSIKDWKYLSSLGAALADL